VGSITNHKADTKSDAKNRPGVFLTPINGFLQNGLRRRGWRWRGWYVEVSQAWYSYVDVGQIWAKARYIVPESIESLSHTWQIGGRCGQRSVDDILERFEDVLNLLDGGEHGGCWWEGRLCRWRGFLAAEQTWLVGVTHRRPEIGRSHACDSFSHRPENLTFCVHGKRLGELQFTTALWLQLSHESCSSYHEAHP